jgi:hypothetical protein
MRQQNRRKVRQDTANGRIYVVRDGVHYWAPANTACANEQVIVLNPTTRSIMVKFAGRMELWTTDATSPAMPR